MAVQGFVYSPILATAQMVDTKSGTITGTVWPLAFQQLSTQITTLQAVANNSFGTNFITIATQPTLGSSDVGYVAYLTDLQHLVYWDGSAWQLLDGDAPGYFRDYAVAPGGGWHICDGTATSYLVVGGASLTTTPFTTPDLTSGSYRKGGTYTGSVNAAVAPGATMSGSTASGNTGTGTTGGNSFTTSGPNNLITNAQTGGGATVAGDHTHTVTVTGLSVPSLTVPSLGVGTLAAAVDATGEPKNLVVSVYFRR